MRKKAILFGLLVLLLQYAWAQTVTFKKAIGDNEDNVGWSVLEIQTGYILVGAGYASDGVSFLIKMFRTDHYGNVVLSKYYGIPNR